MELINETGVVLDIDDPEKIARMLAGGWSPVEAAEQPEVEPLAQPKRRGRPPKVRE